MKLLGILKNILFEEKISNPIVDVSLNDYKIRFILSTHAQERMTRKENDSDITVDEIKSAIEGGDSKAAKKAFEENVSVIDRIADKKIIHKNKAARHKSRLNTAIKSM